MVVTTNNKPPHMTSLNILPSIVYYSTLNMQAL